MPSWVSNHIDKFRGTLRVGSRQAVPAARGARVPGDLGAARDAGAGGGGEPGGESSLLSDYKNLIPGEALAGYVALQAFAEGAKNPDNVRIVLAIIFCVVAVVLRLIGTQDRTTKRPQYGAVILGAVSFILLVYATGGQIFWHRAVEDQTFYAQIFASALGILGPPIYSRMVSE
ncbi:MAG TPA: hypothetical protein VGB98_15255 [Pyrinomonadaceae bacterium]|jgi:hypothetical protein